MHSHLQSIRFTATPYLHSMCYHDKTHCRHLGVSYLWPAVSGKWGEGIPRSCDPVSTTWVMTIFLGCEWLTWHWRLENIGSSTLRLVFEEDKWVMWYETTGFANCDGINACLGTWCPATGRRALPGAPSAEVFTPVSFCHTPTRYNLYTKTLKMMDHVAFFFLTCLWLIDQQ